MKDNKQIIESLHRHTKNIDEEVQSFTKDIAKVKSLIDGNDYVAKLQKALLDCCKSGEFKPSAALDDALLNATIEDTKESDYVGSLKDALKDILGTSEWKESLLASFIGDDFMFGFKKVGVSDEFTKAWEAGLEYCQNQRTKILNKAMSKVKGNFYGGKDY